MQQAPGDVVLYELYVRAFRDANGDGHGDLRGVIEKLDHVASLGVDVLWLLPISPSPLRDDGYDVSDFRGVHPDYGSLDDLRER
jgi:maltose alpha-D-glucosyltransferase / alpha-amylase